jgi:hypothetical protein
MEFAPWSAGSWVIMASCCDAAVMAEQTPINRDTDS